MYYWKLVPQLETAASTFDKCHIFLAQTTNYQTSFPANRKILTHFNGEGLPFLSHPPLIKNHIATLFQTITEL